MTLFIFFEDFSRFLQCVKTFPMAVYLLFPANPQLLVFVIINNYGSEGLNKFLENFGDESCKYGMQD